LNTSRSTLAGRTIGTARIAKRPMRYALLIIPTTLLTMPPYFSVSTCLGFFWPNYIFFKNPIRNQMRVRGCKIVFSDNWSFSGTIRTSGFHHESVIDTTRPTMTLCTNPIRSLGTSLRKRIRIQSGRILFPIPFSQNTRIIRNITLSNGLTHIEPPPATPRSQTSSDTVLGSRPCTS